MNLLRACWKPFAAALAATLYVLGYRGAPFAFDEFLALPIAIETAHPGTYPAGDLLVQGSMHGPFHLYKLASVLWTVGINVDVAWYVLLVLALFAFFLAVWRLGGAMALDPRERALLLMAIAVSPMYRGTLNWSAQPMLSFITASVAVPLGLLAIAAALREQPRTALLYAALAFDVHPSLGICTGIAVLSLAPWRLPARRLFATALPAVLVAAPNLVYLLRHPSASSEGFDAQLWAQFRLFGYHTFVRDHWREGYAWYVFALALAIVAATQLGDVAARRARNTAIVLTVVAAAWITVMNVAPIPAVMPLYLIRASLLTKSLIMGLALTVLTRRRYAGKYASLAPWAAVLAVAHPYYMVGEAAMAIVLGVVLRQSTDRRLAIAGAAAWACGLLTLLVVLAGYSPWLDGLVDLAEPVRLASLAVGVITVGLLLSTPAVAEGTLRVPLGQRALVFAVALPLLAIAINRSAGSGWLPDSPARIGRRLQISRPLPREAGAMDWALNTSPPASLFAIPPEDYPWVRFRLATHRGVYASVHDINQLWYVRGYVRPALERLTVLGVVAEAPHVFNSKAYYQPTCARLKRMAADGVNFYVLAGESTSPAGSVLAYQDLYYAILDVPRSAQNCQI